MTPPERHGPLRAAPNLAWFIARHYLTSRKTGSRFLSFITVVSLGGVVVGVTALIVVIGVMTGMQEDLKGKILSSAPHVLVLQQGSTLRMEHWQDVAEEVRRVDGVVSAAPFVITSVSIVRPGYTQPADLYGLELDPVGPAVTAMAADTGRQEGKDFRRR